MSKVAEIAQTLAEDVELATDHQIPYEEAFNYICETDCMSMNMIIDALI